MMVLLKGGQVFRNGDFHQEDVLVSDGVVFLFSDNDHPTASDVEVFDVSGKYIFPGFTDVHVHLREPGFSYKETVRTGSLAAAAGGYTAVLAMPNVNPPPDSAERLLEMKRVAERDGAAHVYLYGTITKLRAGIEVAPLEEMDDAVAFSDDGSGVQDEAVMLEAMSRAAALGKVIAAHCEDNSLLRGGYIHDGEYARTHGHRGICSESEWGPIKRDLALAERTGCDYHVCHVSAKESVQLIREAKARGVRVTCETAPHYLVFDDSMLEEEGRFKMNPPIRSAQDRAALIEGILDGTVDMIATDHAPHSAEEKSLGLERSMMGVVGLECAASAVYTFLVRPGILPMARFVELMATAPARRFGIGEGVIIDGGRADLTVFDPTREYTLDPEEFCSMGRSTPFAGMKMFGKCIMTIKKGNVIWRENMTRR